MVTIVDEPQKGAELGASEYITKPFSREQLRHILHKYKRSPHTTNHILVVEDDLHTREIATQLLQKDGWQVSTARNGLEALDFLDEFTPHVILLDLMMPEMDGFMFLEALRTHETKASQHIPIVVFTAKDLSTQERALLSERAQRVCIKGKSLDEQSAFTQVREAIHSLKR